MATAPTWAPTIGEVYGDWKGKLIVAGLVVWDRVVASVAGVPSYGAAQPGGYQIPDDVEFMSLNSYAAADSVVLPAAVGGKRVRLSVGSNGCRLWASGVAAIFINGTVANRTNELVMPADSLVDCQAISDTVWRVVGWDSSGVALTLVVSAR